MSQIKNNPDTQTFQRGDGGAFAFRGKDKKFWKSLDELADSESYREFVQREFPDSASEILNPVTRRSFMGLMASSMALAGLTGCNILRRPKEKILPYNNQPENLVPGRPLYFATSMALGEEVTGLVVESHEGRPTKIEGNKLHNASLGATTKFHQASILDLYNPDRAKKVYNKGSESSWESFWSENADSLKAYRQNKGEGLRFLSEYITSPSTAAVRAHLLKKFPEAKWHTYEAVNRDNAIQGLDAATGQMVNPHYRLSSAMRILSVDCDFLGQEIDALANTRAWIKKRDPDKGSMSRMYMVESNYSITGARADNRLKLKPSQVRKVLWRVADEIFNTHGLPLPANVPDSFKNLCKQSAGLTRDIGQEKWIKSMVNDLVKNGAGSLVCVGKHQGPAVHALAYIINSGLGSIGRTVDYKLSKTAQFNEKPVSSIASLRELTFAMEQGKVETLIILGSNPVYSTPADIPFAKALSKVKNSIHLTGEYNETSVNCSWQLPRSHYLEEWSDGAAYDGTLSVAQPLIYPLYNSLGVAEFLSRLSGYSHKDAYGIVTHYWSNADNTKGLSGSWKKWIHDGVIQNSDSPTIATSISYRSFERICQTHLNNIRKIKVGTFEVIFREHHSMYDGRFAGNGWLQELPDPMTRLTWDNAALVSYKTAEKFGVKDKIVNSHASGTNLGDTDFPMVEVSFNNRTLKIPAFVLPGLSEDTVLIASGYGRVHSGGVGSGSGFNAANIQTGHEYSEMLDASFSKSSGSYQLASTQEHWSLEGRDIVRTETVTSSHDTHHGHGAAPSLHSEHDYSKGMQWGMVMDLNKCTGCGGCVTACQAENNIPVVGKEQVALNREMHWIRMDRYFAGQDIDNPQVVHQPMACQQCEMAPCETVCPVAATTHSSEGLNDMAYNRCIGTRYCSNNCPYKARRFNFFNYTNDYAKSRQMANNPDVTVRFRGVMEKCTYCVQRINEQRIVYKNQGNEWIPDGAVVPACEQSCPAEAITFGNINDEKSRVAHEKHNRRNYDLLAELNTRPRTSYLSRVLNPNPEIEPEESHGKGHG